MEDFEIKQNELDTFTADQEIRGYLKETAKWGKFLAIVGYIGIGLLILISVVMMVWLSSFSKIPNMNFPMGLIGLVYILIAAIYFFPVHYLHKFSDKISQGLRANHIGTITSGFENLKSLFKFMGFFTIVIFSIYILVIVIAVPVLFFLKP